MHKKTVLILFSAIILLCLLLSSLVQVNYRLSDYLPDEVPSTVAIKTMQEHFDENIPNLLICMKDVSVAEALVFKEQIKALSGVEGVLWLDDAISIYTPLEMADKDTVEAWYKDGNALFSVTVNKDQIANHVIAIREFVGSRGIIAGEAVNQTNIQNSTVNEVAKITLYVIPLVLIILLLSTGSWFEPVLFIITIGVAIIINEGTNAFLNNVSFVTRSTSAVLQLAVSMDYAVFLLHRFSRYRQEGMEIREAMSKAMAGSFSAIAASMMTTVIGFLVLVLMRFRIGADMGIVLAKGVLLSFLCVMILLPVLAVATAKIMDRTRHRPFLPSFHKFGRFVVRICVPLAIVVMILIIPGYLGQRNNQFVYGSSGMNSVESQAGRDAEEINGMFGESVQMVLLVPSGDIVNEADLCGKLENTAHVKSVISYTNLIGEQIPEDILSEDQLSQFRSDGFSRIILYVDTNDEGEEAFRTVEEVRAAANGYYPGNYYLVGQSVVNYDLKDTIVKDNHVVTIAVVLAIGLVLLLTFRSLSIPLVLLLVIEGATWLNLSIPYFTGDTLTFLGYQIISSVQLGATVDYGILFVQHYMDNRKTYTKREAVVKTVSETAASILTPASILTIAGLTLGLVSSNAIISQLGAVLGRGAALSAALVLLMLPGILLLCDGIIQKTTLKKNGGGRKMKLLSKKIITLIMAALLIFTIPSRASAGEALIEPVKEEAVYVKLSGDGTAASTYIVNSFDVAEAGRFVDYGNYTEVRNLTTTEKLEIDGDSVSIDAPQGRFYYQGGMDGAKLPWTVNIQYVLNGVPVSAHETAGAAGHLEIQISIRRSPDTNVVFDENYSLQVVLTLDTRLCSSIEAKDATLASSGGDQVVTFIKLPGTDADYAVSMEVKDFEMDSVRITGIPFSMHFNLPDIDEWIDGLSDLQEGIKDLNGGAEDLADGAGGIVSGANKFHNGLKEMQNGMDGLKAGFSQLIGKNTEMLNGSQVILTALETMQNGLETYLPDIESITAFTEGSGAVLSGVNQLASGLGALEDSFALADGNISQQTGGAYTGLQQANEATISTLNQQITLLQSDPIGNAAQIEQLTWIAGLLTANNQLLGGLKTGISGDGTAQNIGLKAAAGALALQYGTFHEGISGLPDMLAGMASGLVGLKDGLEQLADNYEIFHSGLGEYLGGTKGIYDAYSTLCGGFSNMVTGSNELLSGIESLYDGLRAYADGTGEFQSQTSGIDTDIENEIDSLVSQFSADGFTPVSFASEKNKNVKAVQFVMMTEDIRIEKDETVQAPESENTGFLERLLNLFG
ncbi:MAG: efflux RND transporter permease subunit [Christensenellales bacterium]